MAVLDFVEAEIETQYRLTWVPQWDYQCLIYIILDGQNGG